MLTSLKLLHEEDLPVKQMIETTNKAQTLNLTHKMKIYKNREEHSPGSRQQAAATVVVGAQELSEVL